MLPAAPSLASSLRKPTCRGFCCRTRLGLVGAFHKCKAAFWATLERHRRRETAPPLAKDTLLQHRPCTDILAICFMLIAVAILVARKLAQYDGGMAEVEMA